MDTVDFDDLPPATPESPSEPDGLRIVPDEEPSIDANLCKTCGNEIIREPGKRGRAPSYHPECRPSSRAKKKPKQSVKTGTYAEGIKGILQTAAFGLFVAARENNKVLLADSKAVAESSDNIAVALDQLAQERPEIAAVLDKILAVGPYGVLIAAVAPMVMQIAANHGVKLPGTPGAEEYLAAA